MVYQFWGLVLSIFPSQIPFSLVSWKDSLQSRKTSQIQYILIMNPSEKAWDNSLMRSEKVKVSVSHTAQGSSLLSCL